MTVMTPGLADFRWIVPGVGSGGLLRGLVRADLLDGSWFLGWADAKRAATVRERRLQDCSPLPVGRGSEDWK